MALVLLSVVFATSAFSLTIGRRLRRLTRSVRRKRSALTSNIDEQLAALAAVQAFGRTGGEISRLSRQNDAMTRTLIREARVRGLLRAVAAGSTWLALVAVLAVGASEVAAGRLTLGGIVVAVVLVRQLNASLRSVALAHDYWQRAQVSRNKISDFLASSSRPPDGPATPRLRVRKGHIEFVAATVKGALAGVDVVAESGQLVAVVGPTGAGKSTLLACVARLTELESGAVLIDGQDVARCSLETIHRRIGVVAPDLPLMRGTIRRNLVYRFRSASDEEVARQVRAWRLDEVLSGRRHGIETWLAEGGKNLSLGERQRIALARAWMGNPPILLLDEPSAGLDSVGREIFKQMLLRHHRTALLVTHEPAEAALADQVWHMESGRVVRVESGDQFRRTTRRSGFAWSA